MNGWVQAYRQAPELFDAFARAEDPDGRVVAALRAAASFEGSHVLELGCGSGRFGSELAEGTASWTGIEPEAPMLCLAQAAWGRPGMRLARARGEQLPFAERSMDAAVATWVLADLSPSRRHLLLDETERVLRPGASLWLLENAGGCEFSQLEGGAGPDWALAAGFEAVGRIETEIRFPDQAVAERCLGFLLGARALEQLREQPRRRFSHRVLILRRTKAASRSRS